MPRPDAVWIPEATKGGGKLGARIARVTAVADALLEVDRSAGEKSYVRKQPHGRLFVTRDPYDSILFPTGHARSGSPRYRWERRGDGVEVGYLLEDAICPKT
jgi:hypothetical protein